jgi:hypothetical protein
MSTSAFYNGMCVLSTIFNILFIVSSRQLEQGLTKHTKKRTRIHFEM